VAVLRRGGTARAGPTYVDAGTGGGDIGGGFYPVEVDAGLDLDAGAGGICPAVSDAGGGICDTAADGGPYGGGLC
jgi:hypothetical protein